MDKRTIVVQHIPATAYSRERYIAQAAGVLNVVTLACYLPYKQPELAIARNLCHLNGWTDNLVGGVLPEGDTVFTFRVEGM